MASFVRVERSAHVATVTITRADKLNAINAAVLSELAEAFSSLSSASGADTCRAAILTGEGKAFVAGADIAEMASLSPAEAKHFSEVGHRLGAQIEAAAFPVIAAVNGFALGGGAELALACDFIYASEKAKFGQPEVNLGVIPGFGGTQRLARRVGIAHARELIYSGDIISAARAEMIGLVNAVFAPDELLPNARALAEKIAQKGPLAVASAKRVLLRGEGQGLVSACELEAQAFGLLFGTEDQKAGMKAFVEKAKVEFAGR